MTNHKNAWYFCKTTKKKKKMNLKERNLSLKNLLFLTKKFTEIDLT